MQIKIYLSMLKVIPVPKVLTDLSPFYQFLAKVMIVPFRRQGFPMVLRKKSPRLTAFGLYFFHKNLDCGGTIIRKAKN